MDRSTKYQLFAASEAEAWQMFSQAPSVRLAGVADGRPVLRTLSAVVLDGALCVHGADAGEKRGLLGPVVASCDEVIAQVPSYWIHPELACPASTYYLSAIAEGELQPVHDLDRKAAIMQALMERFQPEGGHAPLRADDRRYAKVLQELLIAELRPTRLSAKRKLGQHRSKRQIEGVLAGLWERGAPGDLRAIELIRAAHPEAPSFQRGPEDAQLHVLPSVRDAREVAALLQGEYWTGGLSFEHLVRAQLSSEAWVVARGPEGVRASARAMSDGTRSAWVMDVIVHPARRGRGYGRALMQLLLEHPRLRHALRIGLRTRSPAYYEPLGFRALQLAEVEMRLTR